MTTPMPEILAVTSVESSAAITTAMEMLEFAKEAYRRKHKLTCLGHEDICTIEMIVRSAIALLQHNELWNMNSTLENLESNLNAVFGELGFFDKDEPTE